MGVFVCSYLFWSFVYERNAFLHTKWNVRTRNVGIQLKHRPLWGLKIQSSHMNFYNRIQIILLQYFGNLHFDDHTLPQLAKLLPVVLRLNVVQVVHWYHCRTTVVSHSSYSGSNKSEVTATYALRLFFPPFTVETVTIISHFNQIAKSFWAQPVVEPIMLTYISHCVAV